ncbi:MAG: DUF3311 domain-containing protein [Acidobacteria bacterium]|nr:DUF3311 domain-containing protein [Acidobacteriota bacterium]
MVKKRTTWLALLLGAIPFITLVLALPLVNRVEPLILGLPFLLFWILAWVILTPVILWLAYLAERRCRRSDDGEAP